jgi:TatA/E family protein of Tat protein translocase
MGNIGPFEIAVVLVVALLVFGPKRLPEMGRQVGRAMREFRDATSGIRSELGVDEMLQDVQDIKSNLGVDELTQSVADIKSGLTVSAADMTPATPGTTADPSPDAAPMTTADSSSPETTAAETPSAGVAAPPDDDVTPPDDVTAPAGAVAPPDDEAARDRAPGAGLSH